jgi:predicted ATPase
MRIKKLHIRNFKSLVDFELSDLPQVAVFVGPNASGKSNIFEALEFLNYVVRFSIEAPQFFGGKPSILSYNFANLLNDDVKREMIQMFVGWKDELSISFRASFAKEEKWNNTFSAIDGNFRHPSFPAIKNFSIFDVRNFEKRNAFLDDWQQKKEYENDFEIFVDNFCRLFIGESKLNRIKEPARTDTLLPDGSNVGNVLGKIFQNAELRDDFNEWVQILIPEFSKLEVRQSNIDGTFDYVVYEKHSDRPFTRELLSDGTKNILCIMALVYQSTTAQFLCVEEPENGLHPQAIELLVDFLTEKSEQFGHHIWINTHSRSLVRRVKISQLVLVNKIDGQTRAKQYSDDEGIDLKTDEAWLTNALGGGILWSR